MSYISNSINTRFGKKLWHPVYAKLLTNAESSVVSSIRIRIWVEVSGDTIKLSDSLYDT